MQKHQTHAFTLIEILVGIVIFSIIIVWGFQALGAVNLGKVRLMEATNTTKDMLYVTEKLIEEIKAGWTLDYEEYFNRRVIGLKLENGHYKFPSGFGNMGRNVWADDFWEYFYYCRSGNTSNKNMGNPVNNKELGCFDSQYARSSHAGDGWWGDTDYSWSANILGENILTDSWETPRKPWKNEFGDQQRYGQYSFQVMDYNSNLDNDKWDEDGDGSIIGDDDDENTGYAPRVVINPDDMTKDTNTTHEIYLISADKKNRTYFRWRWYEDPDAPEAKKTACKNNKQTFQDGCIGTVEYIKLEWKDWGKLHDSWTQNFDPPTAWDLPSKTDQEWLSDGIIDTWVIHEDFASTEVIAGVDDVKEHSNGDFGTGKAKMDQYWQPLFSDDISVTDFKVEIYPHTDPKLGWKHFPDWPNWVPNAAEKNKAINIAPYIKISLSLQPSWKKRMSGNTEDTTTYQYSTTIHLDENFSSH